MKLRMIRELSAILWKDLLLVLALAAGFIVLSAGLAVVAQTTVGVFTSMRINGNTWSTTSGTGVLTFPNSTTTIIGTNTTSILTNKTLDAVSGTGNALTVADGIWIQAARCDNATATSPQWSFPTSNPGVPACQTGTNTQFGTMDFADGANTLSAQYHLRLPPDYLGGLVARIHWFTAATTNSVVWQVATVCVADDEVTDPAFNSVGAGAVIDAAKGTTLELNDATSTPNTTGCAANELMFIRVFRDPTHGSDSLADTARLVGVHLYFQRTI